MVNRLDGTCKCAMALECVLLLLKLRYIFKEVVLHLKQKKA